MFNKIKSEKGITLISLIVYVIVMLIVVSIIGTVTSYFYANVNNEYSETKDDYNETNIDIYFLNDLKNKKVNVALVNENEKIIMLEYEDSTHISYTIADNGIYRDYVKIYNKTEDEEMKFSIENKKLIIYKNDVEFKSYVFNN